MKHEHFYNFYIQDPQRYVHMGVGSEIFLVQSRSDYKNSDVWSDFVKC